MANINQNTFKLRVTAIFLIAVGYGWAGGRFIPSDAPWVAYLFQGIILSILLVLALGFFNNIYLNRRDPKWQVRGLGIFAFLSLLINLANIVLGLSNSSNHSFGAHHTFADLVPIVILIVGDLLLLITLLTSPKETAKSI